MSESSEMAGLLTVQQRQFLRGNNDDISTRGKYAARERIRGRVVASLDDASTLERQLDPGEIDKVADEAAPNTLAEGTRSLVALLYRLVDTSGLDPEALIEDGMSRARGERLERIFEKLEGDPARPVTPGELNTLNDAGYLQEETHSQLFKRWLGGAGKLTVGDVDDVVPNLCE